MTDRNLHLITFLGTGDYKRAVYEWRDGRQIETSLFPTALPRFLPEIGSATAFVTEEAEKKHGERLDAEWPADWRPDHVPIPDGKSPDELWAIFEKIVAAVPADSRLVFDITHAFRSIPLISVLAVAYLWSARNVQLHALVYGAYDARHGEPPVAPVFDLTPMVNLLEWISAVERFRHHLDGGPLQHLLEGIQRKAHGSGDPEPPRRLQNLGNKVKKLTDALLLGRVREVLSEAPKLADMLNNRQLHAEADRWAKPFSLMLEPLRKLLGEIASGAETDLAAHHSLAAFYNERRLYPLAITVLREWIISEACRGAGVGDADLFDVDRRKAVEDVLGQCHAALCEKRPLPAAPVWIESFAARGLLDLWQGVPDVRNDIDHAGMRRNALAADRLIANVRKLFDRHSTVAEEVKAVTEVVVYSIGVGEPIAPGEPLPPPPAIPRAAVVVIEGRAPIWRYGMALHRLHGSPAAAVAVYDPRLGAVIVASHDPRYAEGQVIELSLE